MLTSNQVLLIDEKTFEYFSPNMVLLKRFKPAEEINSPK